MPQTEDLILQCAWCNRIKDQGKWVPFPSKITDASHGICPDCADKVYKDMGWSRGTPREKNPMAKSTGALELVKLNGHYVMSGENIEMVFLIKRRKGERIIDVILNNFILGGVHVKKVTKMKPRKKVMLISETKK